MPPLQKKMRRILIVEDEIEAAEAYQDLISDHFEAKITRTVSEAKKLISIFKPNAVLTDLKLSGESGISLLKFLEEIPHIGRVAITGYPNEFIRHLINDVKVDRILTKPILEEDELLEAIRVSLKFAKERVFLKGKMSFDEILTVDEVSELLKVGRTTVFKFVKDMNLKSVKMGGSRRFRKKDVIHWIEKNVIE